MKKLSKGDMEDLVHLSFFVEIGKAIVSSHSLTEILNRIMEQIGKIFSPLNWSLFLKDHKTGELVFKVVVGEASEKLKGMRISGKEGITGWIASTGQAVIIEDVEKDKRFNKDIDRMTGFTTKSIIGVPLKSGDRVLGVIELINKLNGDAFTPFELTVLSTIADFAAIAIEKAYYVQAIKRISRQDHLTGCLNRRSMDLVLQREMERHRRSGTPFSVLLLDINGFKQINDSKGHQYGDEVLQCCAQILQEHVRQVDYVARYGGDEFAVIMPETGRESAAMVRQRILTYIEERNRRDDTQFPFKASIGISTLDDEEVDDVESLIENSDRDMYSQKGKGASMRIDENLLDFLEDEQRS